MLAVLAVGFVVLTVVLLSHAIFETVAVISACTERGDSLATTFQNLAFSAPGRLIVFFVGFGPLWFALLRNAHPRTLRPLLWLFIVALGFCVFGGIVTSPTTFPSDPFARSFVETAGDVVSGTTRPAAMWVVAKQDTLLSGFLPTILATILTWLFARSAHRRDAR